MKLLTVRLAHKKGFRRTIFADQDSLCMSSGTRILLSSVMFRPPGRSTDFVVN